MDEHTSNDQHAPAAPDHGSSRNKRLGGVTFDDIAEGLVWPHLVRALGYSFGPSRILIGFLVALWVFGGAWLINWLTDRLFAEEGETLRTAFGALAVYWPTGGAMGLMDRVTLFWPAVGEAPGWQWGLLALWVLPVAMLGGLAIARQVGLDFCASRSLSLVAAVRFAVARWKAVLVASLAPIVLVAIIGIALWLYGLVFFTTAFMGVIGAILFGVLLLPALLAVITAFVYALAFWMMPAAIAVEDTDGIDSVQRTFSYVLNRIVRYASYLFVVGVILYGAYWAAQSALRATAGFALDATGTDRIELRSIEASGSRFARDVRTLEEQREGFARDGGALPEAMRLELERQLDQGMQALRERYDWEPPASLRIIEGWLQIMWLAFIGWVISFKASAGTMLYLAMRKVHDEQDVREIYVPEE